MWEGETISWYIRRRRLERCAEQLLDSFHDRRHMREIAFTSGFSTLSHFCPSFRDQYGLSPRGVPAALISPCDFVTGSPRAYKKTLLPSQWRL